jgi:hypothetical protein
MLRIYCRFLHRSDETTSEIDMPISSNMSLLTNIHLSVSLSPCSHALRPIASKPIKVRAIPISLQTYCAYKLGSAQGRLLSTLLAAIAEFERELIRERTGEGRKRAMSKGIRFGRKLKRSDYQKHEAIKRRGNGETLSEIAKSYAVSISMISRL